MTDLSAVVRVAEIRAREKAATPGEWETEDCGVGTDGRATIQVVETIVGTVVAEIEKRDMDVVDAEFIAHARQDIPFLLARLDEANETLRAIAEGDESALLLPPCEYDPLLAVKAMQDLARAFLSGGDTATKETT